MRQNVRHPLTMTSTPARIGIVMVVVLMFATVGVSRGAQLIPSLGFTKSTDSSAGDGKVFGGVALRASLLRFMSLEGGIAYRDESFSNGDLKVRMWPVTASVWLTPFPVVYAGGGLGWYRTTYDYRSSLPYNDTTTSKVGVHLGGGLAIPLAPSLGLDLNGRYIFMQKDNSIQFPSKFNPDFWNASLGLAIKF